MPITIRHGAPLPGVAPPAARPRFWRRYLGIFVLTTVILAGAVMGALALVGRVFPGELDLHGWIAMTLGVVVASALGTGLMCLAFYSARIRRDDEVYERWHANEADAAPDERR